MRVVGTRRREREPSFAADEGVRDAYVAHSAELFRFAFRALGDRGAAEDVLQETFVRGWRARDRFDPQLASLRVWLFAITRNVLIDHSRAAAVRPWERHLIDLTTSEQVGPVSADPSEQLLRERIVGEALRRLGDEHRQALTETLPTGRTTRSRPSSASPSAPRAVGCSTASRPCAS